MTRTARRRSTAVSAQPPIWQLSAQGRFRRLLLSAICSLWGGGAYAAPFGSPGYFAQLPATGGKPTTTTGSVPSATVPGAVTTAQQAQLLSRRSAEDFARAAEAIAAAQAAQTAAHTAAQQLTIDTVRQVPDGLTPRGLNPTSQAALDAASPATCSATNTCTWLNAQLPSQTQNANGTLTVTVQQTGQKAILTWDSFNVGKNTTLHFDQTAGTQVDGSNNWIALNRITAEDLSPSKILGSIQAEGSVYLINPYGIIFGGSSQVNVHTLIASSLSLFSSDVATSNKKFVEQGIDGILDGANLLLTAGAKTADGQLILPGDIEVEEGAKIATGELGFSLLAAPNVRNDGHIVATDGQAILAAGTQIARDSGVSSSAAVSSSDFKVKAIGTVGSDASGLPPNATVLNSGLIESRRGNVSLVGLNVEQDGVVVASTSLTRAGSITMRAFDEEDQSIHRGGSLLLGGNSVTALLPDEDGETTTSSSDATANFKLGSVNLSGGAVRLARDDTTQSSALIEAPGQNVSVSADYGSNNGLGLHDSSVFGRVYLDQGAIIDVAGLADVQLAMSANLLTIPRIGLNELADSPLQRGGVLYGSSITVDTRNTGTRSDGTSWVGTPLANLSGYVEQVSRTIDQMLQNGGSIKLAGNEVIAQKGSFLNLDAGYIHYLGGVIATTQLLTSQGQVVDIAKADPGIRYSGIAGLFTEDHPRWNLTFTYSNPLLKQSGKYESEYVQSGNGGALQVFGLSSTLLTGDVSAQAFAGRHQVADGKMPFGGSFYFGSGKGLGSLAFSSNVIPYGPSVVLQAEDFDLAQIDAGFKFDTPLTTSASLSDTANILHWTPISARMLEQAGFSKVSLVADEVHDSSTLGMGGEVLVNAGADLSVRPGGTINLIGSRVTVLGDLTATSGAISMTGTGDTNVAGSTVLAQSQAAGSGPASGSIVIGSGVTLSTKGQWVNDAGLDIDQQSGGSYVNGGSITLQTLLAGVKNPGSGCGGLPADCIADTTGSIILEQNSRLDVSSGGYVLPSGHLQMSDGIAQGKGGDIALLAAVNDISRVTPATVSSQYAPLNSRIQLDGSLIGYGFSAGGTLSLRALGIQIGDSVEASPDWTLKLSASFFENQGFGEYALYANYDASVSGNTQLVVAQSNLLPNFAALLTARTGTDLEAVDADHPLGIYASIGRLDDYHRQASNWSLYAGDYLSWGSSVFVPDYSAQGISGALTVNKGAVIAADAGAALKLGSTRQLSVDGSLIAHGGRITLTGDTADGGYEVNPSTGLAVYSSTSKSVWLGANSLLDVSGVALFNPLAAPVTADGRTFVPRSGKLLDGGTVTLSNNTGYIVALGCADVAEGCAGGAPGARIDVSGVNAEFDLPSSGSGATYTAQTVASNAGTVQLGVGGGLLFNAALSAHAGGEQAMGGTLIVAPEVSSRPASNGFTGAQELQILSGTAVLPAEALTPGVALEQGDKPSGIVKFYTGTLENSGIENLRLGVDRKLTGNALLPVSFGENVSLALERSIEINASQLAGLPTGSGSSHVQLLAPYVSLHGYVPGGTYTDIPALAAPSAGIDLSVVAGQIDLGGKLALQNFATASFSADGDIRFLTPAAYGYVVPDTTEAAIAVPGVLYTAGDLSFTAAQLYPATGNTFIIDAVGVLLDPQTGARAPTTVSFFANSNSASAQAPLSAGGRLLVDATTIQQNGYLRAPQGQILLGVANVSDANIKSLFGFDSGDTDVGAIQLPLTPTTSVQLGAGSLTSVSLNGLTVPFGTTADGVNWIYDGYAGAPDASESLLPAPANLVGPPEKNISLNGSNVAVSAGATVDLSGGGDLQAQEWVPGTGGSRDVLAASNVYAIIPGYKGPAAYDPAIAGSDPLIGKAVYLSGAAGLPAGIYTLLPGKYATLPGAYRIVQDTKAIDTQSSQNRTLPDGSLYVAGYFTDLLTGARDARSTAFKVQSANVWQQYSEYALSSANTYFADLAKSSGTVTPPLPMDAGHLVLAATGTLSLGATLNTSTPQGGIGAQVDIASSKLQITSDTSTALDGYVQVSASELDQLNASSLLIGGTRSRTADGDLLTAVASSVVLDNGSQTLYAPEIMLLSAASVDPGSGVNLTANSSIEARGAITALADAPIIIGKTGTVKTAVSGDGALLRVSNGAAVPIERINVPGSAGVAGTPNGLLSIAAGASVKAGTSVTLDSSGKTQLDPGARISAKEIDADAQLITLSSDDTTQADGLVVGPQLLALFSQAERISLGSRSAINFVGDFTLKLDQELALSAGAFTGNGNVSLAASSLTLSNALNAVAPTSVAGTGTLTLNADQLYFGAGDKSQSGFASISASAQKTITVRGSGSFDFGAADVSMTTPRLLADSGADNSLRTSGTMTIGGRANSDSTDIAPLGGKLGLAAGTLSVDTWVQAASGSLKLEASSGDLTMGDKAFLDARGSSKTFYDVDQYAPGGAIALTADQGKLSLAEGSVVDVSAAAAGGDAGRLALSAPVQNAELNGTLKGRASSGGRGGSFNLDAGQGINLDSLASSMGGAGFDQAIAIRARSGDLSLSTGQTLAAESISLTTDGANSHLSIAGTLDASGSSGGSISLFGRGQLQVLGSLLARATAAGQDGGKITLGTSGISTSGDGVNADFGYQNVLAANAGFITIGPGAVLDVAGSGGNGKVSIRAPLLSDGSIPISIDPTAQINNASEVSLEAYASWSTTTRDQCANANCATDSHYFDGIIDPAGWYDAGGQLVPGTFVDYLGKKVAAGSLEANYFTPTQINLAHRDFYQTTLLNFVQLDRAALEAPFAGIANFKLRPGIELVNPASADVNGGNISVLTNWNLGAGSRDVNGNLQLAYRYHGSIAPVLSLRAAENISFQASISDGFFQYANPIPFASPSNPLDNSASPVATYKNPLPLLSASLDAATLKPDGTVTTADSTSYRIVAGADDQSSNPLAVNAGSSGSVELDSHTTGRVSSSGTKTRALVAPTMIRSGVGSIDIAAAQDVQLLDAVAPGVIYTGGVPAAGTVPVSTSSVIKSKNNGQPYVIDTGVVNPDSAGDISIDAGRDIVGIQQVIDTDGSRTGLDVIKPVKSNDVSQYWWPWLQTNSSYISFGIFDQGVMSAGGNVSVNAGRDISQLSVSLPTTWYIPAGTADAVVVGGGKLEVHAAGDILSGDYLVARGSGRISAGGVIAADSARNLKFGTLLALQDAKLQVSAAGAVDIAAIYNPAYMFSSAATLSYSAASSVAVVSSSGDISLGGGTLPSFRFGNNFADSSSANLVYDYILPAALEMTALNGSISILRGGELYPSVLGQLSLIADEGITLSSGGGHGVLGLIDAPSEVLPSPLSSSAFRSSFINYVSDADAGLLHDQEMLHAADPEPVRLYSLSGDIADGKISSQSTGLSRLILSVDKSALIRAGRDIINLSFSGQNLYPGDVTLIAAGRDIYDTPLAVTGVSSAPFIQLGGTGTLLLSAGRNIGPLTSANELLNIGFDPSGTVGAAPIYGITTVGNSLNPYLSAQGANILSVFGVAPGIATQAFADAYIDPAGGVTGVPSYSAQLLAFVKSYLADRDAGSGSAVENMTAEEAWTIFETLPEYQQERMVYAVLFDILNRTGLDYNDPGSPYSQQYGRGYAAIAKLFPASLGYSDNDLSGASNGAKSPVLTGTFDMRGSTVQTQQGGDISIIGPGGNILVGSSSAPANASVEGVGKITPNNQGILTLESGSINLFTDRSVLLAQSRIFTEQGGDVLIWSSNGDINAGKGAKTSSAIPPPQYFCNTDHYCTVDAKSQVSGAGIASLQTDATNGKQGNANLIAPAGTVDAGEAGIRVAGNINVAALRVANAGNIQVQGKTSGVPTSFVDVGALGAANAIGAAIDKTVAQLASERPEEQDAETMITVEVLGFGEPDEEQRKKLRR